jgi:hypothetical protein
MTKYNFGFVEKTKDELRKIEETVEKLKNEKEIINYLKNLETAPLKEKTKNMWFLQSEDFLYQFFCSSNIKVKFLNKEDKYIGYLLYKKIPLYQTRKKAIENLMNTLENNELNLGDKKIIKDIALMTLENNLKIARGNPKNSSIYQYHHCVRTDLSEFARNKLLSYSFDYRSPSKRFQDFNLKQI